MPDYKTPQASLFYTGTTGSADGPTVLWAHGWGQNHEAFSALIESLAPAGRHIAIDFPGFGQSPEPPEKWSTKDYADFMASFIKDNELGPVIWAGHSFGVRVGIQMAAHYPDLIQGFCGLAGAGLKSKRPLHKELYIKARIFLFKTLKAMLPLGLSREWLHTKFGSSDYNNTTGIMRDTFIGVVNEDLVSEASDIKCPTILIYGVNDTETPPELGKRLSGLIPNSQLFLLDGQDHYTLLSSGRHPVIKLINDFIKGL